MKLISISISFLFSVSIANAIQDVPMSSFSPKNGLAGEIKTNLGLSDGNVNSLDWGAGFNVLSRRLFEDQKLFKSKWQISFDYRFSENNSVIYRRYLSSSIRYEGMFNETFGVVSFLQHSFNEFTRLNRRDVIGAGPFIRLLTRDRFQLWTVVAPMYEYEVVDLQSGSTESGINSVVRLASSLGLIWLINDRGADLYNNIYFQPSLNAWSDYRILWVSRLRFPVSDQLYLGTVFNLTFDQRPPNGVNKRDRTLTQELSWSF